MRAAINRYNPDWSGHEIFASGTRNPIGLHWFPGTNILWATVQERDALGDDLVPDYFTHIQQGAFYGCRTPMRAPMRSRATRVTGRIWLRRPSPATS
jgi:hypothetical protein